MFTNAPAILIYGLLGFNAYGVKGAAYATVIGQIYFWKVNVYEENRIKTYAYRI